MYEASSGPAQILWRSGFSAYFVFDTKQTDRRLRQFFTLRNNQQILKMAIALCIRYPLIFFFYLDCGTSRFNCIRCGIRMCVQCNQPTENMRRFWWLLPLRFTKTEMRVSSMATSAASEENELEYTQMRRLLMKTGITREVIVLAGRCMCIVYEWKRLNSHDDEFCRVIAKRIVDDANLSSRPTSNKPPFYQNK